MNTTAMTTTIVRHVTHTAPTTKKSPDVLGRVPAGPCVGMARFGASGTGVALTCKPRKASAAAKWTRRKGVDEVVSGGRDWTTTHNDQSQQSKGELLLSFCLRTMSCSMNEKKQRTETRGERDDRRDQQEEPRSPSHHRHLQGGSKKSTEGRKGTNEEVFK